MLKFKAKSSYEDMLLNNHMIIEEEWGSTPFITTIRGTTSISETDNAKQK